ncbi:hypothetical protein J6590_095375 [Homalodisca vitripennis]|nr:hypothetical protein J6590_095375 [Homalodisca vitripennis]
MFVRSPEDLVVTGLVTRQFVQDNPPGALYDRWQHKLAHDYREIWSSLSATPCPRRVTERSHSSWLCCRQIGRLGVPQWCVLGDHYLVLDKALGFSGASSVIIIIARDESFQLLSSSRALEIPCAEIFQGLGCFRLEVFMSRSYNPGPESFQLPRSSRVLEIPYAEIFQELFELEVFMSEVNAKINLNLVAGEPQIYDNELHKEERYGSYTDTCIPETRFVITTTSPSRRPIITEPVSAVRGGRETERKKRAGPRTLQGRLGPVLSCSEAHARVLSHYNRQVTLVPLGEPREGGIPV